MMGVLADAVLAAGGTVLGVIPDFLTKWEVAHPGVTEMIVTDSMHDRKRRMAEAADAFVMLPGGIGTMDETVEIITWRQLRLHDKPIYICDVAGSAAPFVTAIDGHDRAGLRAAEARDLHRGAASRLLELWAAAWHRLAGHGWTPARRLDPRRAAASAAAERPRCGRPSCAVSAGSTPS